MNHRCKLREMLFVDYYRMLWLAVIPSSTHLRIWNRIRVIRCRLLLEMQSDRVQPRFKMPPRYKWKNVCPSPRYNYHPYLVFCYYYYSLFVYCKLSFFFNFNFPRKVVAVTNQDKEKKSINFTYRELNLLIALILFHLQFAKLKEVNCYLLL